MRRRRPGRSSPASAREPKTRRSSHDQHIAEAGGMGPEPMHRHHSAYVAVEDVSRCAAADACRQAVPDQYLLE